MWNIAYRLFKLIMRRLKVKKIFFGIFSIMLLLLCSGTYAANVPEANFSANVTNGSTPLNVHFMDNSSGDVSNWEWDFDNDDVVDSNEQNPNHTYNNPGNYSVKLKVSGTEGSNQLIKTNYISVLESSVLPNYNDIYIQTANDEGILYNIFGNDTYLIRFEGAGRGLNAVHISTDYSTKYGQITTTTNQSGVFYITDTGGKRYEDNVILMLAVNGTIPDDFAIHIQSSGYSWIPNVIPNTAPDISSVIYNAIGINETFTKADFIYGPQIWKPTGDENYPIFNGQNMDDTNNTFWIMFIDTHVGVLGNGFDSLINQGATKIEYSISNLNSVAVFNVYCYCNQTNNGNNMIAWSNRVLTNNSTGSNPSGYLVTASPPIVADFSSNVTEGNAPLSVNFKDQSSDNVTSWAWDFNNDGIVDSTEQNPTHTYTKSGKYSVKLTVTKDGRSTQETKINYITVNLVDTITPIAFVNTKSGIYNTDKTISIAMNENGTIYYTTDGSTPTEKSRKYTGAFKVSSNTVLKFIAIDKAGNKSPIYVNTYKIDKVSPKVIKTTPKNRYKKFSRDSTIKIKFNENIKKSVNWSKVYVRNLKTGKKVFIKKWIKGNILYIKTSKRIRYSYYSVYIPKYSLKDFAGNNQKYKCYFRFRTSK